jgi:hypothetical protein
LIDWHSQSLFFPNSSCPVYLPFCLNYRRHSLSVPPFSLFDCSDWSGYGDCFLLPLFRPHLPRKPAACRNELSFPFLLRTNSTQSQGIGLVSSLLLINNNPNFCSPNCGATSQTHSQVSLQKTIPTNNQLAALDWEQRPLQRESKQSADYCWFSLHSTRALIFGRPAKEPFSIRTTSSAEQVDSTGRNFLPIERAFLSDCPVQFDIPLSRDFSWVDFGAEHFPRNRRKPRVSSYNLKPGSSVGPQKVSLCRLYLS